MGILFEKNRNNKKGHHDIALNLLSKNKCIQFLDDLLEQKLKKKKFQNLRLNSESIKSIEVFAKLTSLESMSLDKLRILKLYFRIFKHDLDINTEEKTTRLMSIIEDFLDIHKYRMYVEDKYIFRSMVYVYASQNIGRLYCFGSSIQRIPKIYRRFLLGDIYINVDIINAHLCILLEYGERHEISCQILTRLVKDRDNFYTEVSQQISIVNVEKEVISILNKKHFYSDSILLNQLFKEIVEIRDSLWSTFYYPHKYSVDSRNNFKIKTKVTVQSLYCQTKETDYLIDLYNFLYSKTEESKEELHFIPFSDGALVKFKDYVLHASIPTLIEQFNKTTKYVKFKIKDFEDGFEPNDNFRRLQNICNVLPNLYRNDISFLKKHLKIEDEIFNNESIDCIFENAKNQKIKHIEIIKKFDYNVNLKKSLTKKIQENNDPNLVKKLKQVDKEIEEIMAISNEIRYYRLTSDEKKRIQDIASEFEKKIIQGLLEYADSETLLKNFIKEKINTGNEYESKELE